MSDLNNTPENNDAAAFEALMGAEFSADAFEVPAAPAADARPDGLYYLATNDTTSTYEVVVTGRTILHVLVDSAVLAPMPAFAAGKVHPKATAHPIVVATPDRSVVLPTKGKAIMGPKHIITDSVKIYVLPRILDILVKVYNLGA